MTKKTISQEAFDEMVQENVETFEMEPEEAMTSALEELKLQGVNTSGLIMLTPGTQIEEHPVAVAAIALKKQNESSEADESVTCGLLKELQDAFSKDHDSEHLNQMAAVGSKFEVISTLVSLLQKLDRGKTLSEVFYTLQAQMVMLSNRKLFYNVGGPEAVLEVVRKHESDFLIIGQAANLAKSACLQFEGNKCRFVDIGFPQVIHHSIQQQSPEPTTLIAFSRAIYSFCNPDDPVPPASQAFRHARFLASEGLARTFVGKVEQLFSEGFTKDNWDKYGTAAVEALRTVKSLAANDEICQKLSQEGAVLTFLKLWKSYEDVSKAVASVCGVLRQLSQCDAIKHEIMEDGGADLLCRSLLVNIEDPVVLEGVTGVMTNIALRQPLNSHSLVDAGCISNLAIAMQKHSDKPRVLKQICMCTRNMVSRVPELRPCFLEEGFEEMVRSAKSKHPKVCGDPASAVLRDLGLENYA